MKQRLAIYLLLFLLPSLQGKSEERPSISLDDIVSDIYRAATELGETDYEQLQSDLYALHESPIDLNHTSDEELSQLYFLSPRQIDDILAYADRHPFESLYELRMIASLADYEIRDLLPFVRVGAPVSEHNTMYVREVFHDAKHELLTRVDARNIEGYEGTDPMYVQTRYKMDFQRRVTLGVQLRRPAGGAAKDLQYGAYLQLRDIGCLHTLVAGNFQALFGQGLVLAPVFRSGKSAYVQSVGQHTEGLQYYSSVDGEGLHGVGATFRHTWSRQTRLDISGLYSMKRANDSTWHHLLGANLTLRHKGLQAGLTAIENLWSDSIHPYRNAAYNQHYFRGRRQAVIGANIRYNHGWLDAFAEVATAQNEKWGFGVVAGSRFYPTGGVSLVALYRYYSPWFDNALGYAFSETSRIGDENGGYLGFEVTRLSHWKFSGYADVFRFSGPKYGIPEYPTLGYDALLETQYRHSDTWWIDLRLRSKQKGKKAICSTRFQWNIQGSGWSFRTTAEANLTPKDSTAKTDDVPVNHGVTLYQDFMFDFSRLDVNRPIPLTLHLRLQGFDIHEWDNRIYCYEHDVLYAYSTPAIYGSGVRTILCLRWQIIPQLALYFRASETIYTREWAVNRDRPQTRTDLHLLLRATL
ncbi:MAG: hypothetical protein J5761_05310 [Paludibacteraceae bacterium]|nr:hypothetical protein [Paludibacteraceae bacterium]